MNINSDSFIKKLWRGEVSLAKTYWLWGVVVNIVLNLIVGIAPLLNQALAIVISVFAVLYAVFISVAIWKSATIYEGRKLWKYLAKIAVIIPLIAITVNFILPKLSATSSYQSSNECMYKELKKSELQNTQIAINNIASYCHSKVAEHLNSQLGNQMDIKKILESGATYLQVSEALFLRTLELKKYHKREGYTKLSDCNFELTKNINGSKEREFFLDVFAKTYCYELVAINLGSRINYDLYGARKDNISFKEIAEFLEFGKN